MMRIGPFAAFDHRFVVDSDNDDVLSYLNTVFEALTTDQSADLQPVRYELALQQRPGAVYALRRDDRVVVSSQRRRSPVSHLLHQVNRCALRSVKKHGPVLHTGAVVDDSVILLPGHRESGKSTLTLALVLTGCRYLTDEMLLVEAEGRCRPLGRAASLDAGSWRFFPSLQPTIPVGAERYIPNQWQVPLPSSSAALDADPLMIVFQRREVGPPVISELDPLEALRRLLESDFTLRDFPGRDLRSLSALVERARCVEIIVDDPHVAAEAIQSLQGPGDENRFQQRAHDHDATSSSREFQ